MSGLFMAANRVGNTEGVGVYEAALHFTGRDRIWWKGRQIDRPIFCVGWGKRRSSRKLRET